MLIPVMTVIRFDDGLAMTAHRCHIPLTFNMRCVIPFHPSITNYCTCKLSTLARHRLLTTLPTTSQIMLYWIKVRRFRWPRQTINSMSLQKAQSRVCGMRSHTILHQVHTPRFSKGLSRHTYGPAKTYHAILIKYLKKTRKESFPYRGGTTEFRLFI